ncbi:MAG: hypothetical protein LBU32_24735 [Clostridiales bacterium]|jgi:hypothetical protein|nr:hypothetical protein [Clostridiales bacterium]
MKSKQLLLAIGGIEDKYIEEADLELNVSSFKGKGKKLMLSAWRYAPVAACAAIVLAAAISAWQNEYGLLQNPMRPVSDNSASIPKPAATPAQNGTPAENSTAAAVQSDSGESQLAHFFNIGAKVYVQ